MSPCMLLKSIITIYCIDIYVVNNQLMSVFAELLSLLAVFHLQNKSRLELYVVTVCNMSSMVNSVGCRKLLLVNFTAITCVGHRSSKS